MKYSQSQIVELKGKMIRKINALIDSAVKNDTVDELLKKYGIELEEISYATGVTKRSKILVLGQLSGKKKDYQKAAKTCGIEEGNIEFMDYNEIEKFGVESLKGSLKYSDIICGPIPHNIEGMGDTSSFISKIEKTPAEYPKLIKAVANGRLKFSITDFKDCIASTRYYEIFLAGF